jgi:hypothetical protein
MEDDLNIQIKADDIGTVNSPRIFTDATDRYGLSGTIRRIRENPGCLRSNLECYGGRGNDRKPEVEIAPSTFRGRPTGPAIRARARVLSGAESAHAGQALARKHPIVHGLLVPLIHRLRGHKTMHIEVIPIAAQK